MQDKIDSELFNHCKSDKGTLEVFKNLLENKANPNVQKKEGKTAFFHLCENYPDSFELIELFLENGADPNVKNRYEESPFLRWGKFNKKISFKFLKLFLEHKANLNLQDSNGYTLFHDLCQDYPLDF